MPLSDSDDFESADEGHGEHDKKARKKRLSSSNYSDNALESDQEPPKTAFKSVNSDKEQIKDTDGWDEFDIDDEPRDSKEFAINKKSDIKDSHSNKQPIKTQESGSQDTGWDNFDDWGQDDVTVDTPKEPLKPQVTQPKPDIKVVTDKPPAASSGGWGWGWSVDSLLSTATAGISTITSQVSQGITTVLETGIGAPDPEELAKMNLKENESTPKRPEPVESADERTKRRESTEQKESASEAFQFGSLISGVTKFVETTGTKVIAGGLDTLETIGKKTMEVLQDGDPGLAKKRAMLGLDSGDKPVLSQVLREAKAKADEEDELREAKREAKEIHYENLFDDFEGLVHLEALEMLSRQVTMRIEERIRQADPDKRQDIKETLQQVAELCEMPEEDDDEEESHGDSGSKPDAFHERLQTATQDLGLKLQFQPLVKQYTDLLTWLASEPDMTDKAAHKRGVAGLAHATALAVELYHKAAEMLLVKTRRSTADEADALTQLTVVLTKHIGELATLFTDKLNSIASDNKEQINNYITNIFLEAGNSSTYIQNAFHLALPILQIGAV